MSPSKFVETKIFQTSQLSKLIIQGIHPRGKTSQTKFFFSHNFFVALVMLHLFSIYLMKSYTYLGQ